MKEKDVTRRVLEIAKLNLTRSAAIEIKLCRGTSLPFSALAEHQEAALWHAECDRLVFKIPDVGYQNPFDAFLLHKSDAFVAVVYKREVLFINIMKWIAERNSCGRRSLTYEHAKIIADGSYIL